MKSFFSRLLTSLQRLTRGKSASTPCAARDAKSAKNPKEVKRRRTVLVQDGLAIIAAAGLMVFSAAARGVNLLLALGAFFVGFLVVDYAWGAKTLKKLAVRRRLPETIYAGEPFYVEIELDATGRTSPSWAVVVEDEWSAEDSRLEVPAKLRKPRGESVKDVADAGKKGKGKKSRERGAKSTDKGRGSLSPQDAASDSNPVIQAISDGSDTVRPVVYFPAIRSGERLKEYYVGVMLRRGRRRLVGLSVSTRFPCGFFRSMQSFAAPDELVVFPRVGTLTSDWDAYAGSLTQEASVATSLTSRAPDETVAIRDWRPGDSSRTIAWRATAKRNRLQTREFAKRHTRTIVIVLDLYAPDAEKRQSPDEEARRWAQVEKAVSFTATLVRAWATADSRLVFTLNGAELASEQGTTSAAPKDEWNEIIGGGSTRRVMTRLADAVETSVDRLGDFLASTPTHASNDAQIVVVSLGSARASRDADAVVYGAGMNNLRFIDASSPSFDRYFQFDAPAEEGGATP